AQRALAEAKNVEVIHSPDFASQVVAAINDLPNERLSIALPDMMPSAIMSRIKQTSHDITSQFDALLMQKSQLEIAEVRKAAALADEGYEVFCNAVRPGRTEFDVIVEIEAFFR